MELEMSETSQRNLGSTSSVQRSSSTTADSASISSGVGSGSHLITIENLDAINGIHQGATPSIPSMSNSQITPASNNSAGTSNGQSSSPNEDPQKKPSAGTSKGKMVETNEEKPGPSEASGNETNAGERTLDEYRTMCGPLLRAAINDDWPAAKEFLKKNPHCDRAPITKEKATVLHVAVIEEHTTFVKELLKWMSPADLELKTVNGFTALHSAAQSGIVRIAMQLVEKNNELLSITDNSGDMPLNVAAYVGHTEMVTYLFSETPLEKLTADKRIELLECTSYNDMYGIALEILDTYQKIASGDIEFAWRALEMLASKPLAIGSESQLSLWKSRLNSWFKGICNKAGMNALAHHELVERLWKLVAIPDEQSTLYLVHSHITLLFEAAKVGNVEFLKIITRSYPDLLWQLDKDNMSLFHIAIKYRQESVVNLIYETNTITYSLASFITFESEDNILHLAGHLAPLDRVNIVLGGFRMQRELLWFKEIETIVPPSYMNMKNKKGLTPKELFKKEHEALQIDAETWMKNTSNNCMVVATLITAVVFAAVFSVPGGNNQEHNQEQGTPILLRNTWFKVFFISNAIALFSSSASILLFLSMFVSRFREEDFYVSVPSKLLLALATLFISIMGMIVAFSAACILMYSHGTSWAPVVLSALAVIPIISYSLVNCKELFVDLIVSSYKSRFLFRRPSKRSGLFSRKMPNREWINRKYEIQAKRNERENVGGSRNVEEKSPRKECELTPENMKFKPNEMKGKMLEVPGMLKKESPRKECELTPVG